MDYNLPKPFRPKNVTNGNANQEVTHFTIDILKDGASAYEHPDSSLYTHQMLVKNGVASRKRIIGDKMTILYSHFQQN